jgi:hypothetical protein
MHPTIPLRFVFNETERPELSRRWIEQLMRSANSTGGVELLPENLDTGPIRTAPAQPSTVGIDVQRVKGGEG